MGSIGDEAVKRVHKYLLLHVYNQAGVHITNSFVYASCPMMRDLLFLKNILDLSRCIYEPNGYRRLRTSFPTHSRDAFLTETYISVGSCGVPCKMG